MDTNKKNRAILWLCIKDNTEILIGNQCNKISL